MIRLMSSLLVLSMLVSGCAVATPGTRLLQCKSLCAGQKVEVYKDEELECRCNLDKEKDNE